MRAVLCRTLGDIANLTVADDVPPPPLTDGKVRIAVKAAGVNFPDILMVEGKYQVKPPLPFIPGLEVTGEVTECGAGVTHVKPGDRAFAFARSGGSYATEIVLPGAIVTPIPDAMDWVSAAAFPVAYGTAPFALEYRGRLQKGETLLVLGAAGGVGIAAIEIGKFMGARVIAAAGGAEKGAICRQHGADEVIDYTSENLRDRVLALTGGKGVDVVFDPVGGSAFEQCVRCIGWEGRILIIGFASGDIPKVATNMILVKNFSVVGAVFGAHSDRFPDDTRLRLGRLLEHYGKGLFKPRIHKVLPFEEVRTALAEITGRRVVGKMVLTP